MCKKNGVKKKSLSSPNSGRDLVSLLWCFWQIVCLLYLCFENGSYNLFTFWKKSQTIIIELGTLSNWFHLIWIKNEFVVIFWSSSQQWTLTNNSGLVLQWWSEDGEERWVRDEGVGMLPPSLICTSELFYGQKPRETSGEQWVGKWWLKGEVGMGFWIFLV